MSDGGDPGAVSPRYAVIGHPVAHSKSPAIHQAFAQQRGRQLCYDRILAPRDGFRAALAWFQKQGGCGLSVTLPFKEEAFRAASEHTPRVRRAGAANTLSLRSDGSWSAANTDGPGLVADLERNLGLEPRGYRLLLLGAGGAARGVLGSLLECRPRSLVLANRTPERARALADSYADSGAPRAQSYDALAGQQFDLIINATSLSLQGRLPPLPPDLIAAGGTCYDLAYADRPTVFLDWGRAQGAALLSDGLGMLVEQAAVAFHSWHGEPRPDTGPVIRSLRAGSLPPQPPVLEAPPARYDP